MKALCIGDYKYCMLPEGVTDMDSLLEYLNKNYHSFVKLNVWDESTSVAPYFIEESMKEELTNIANINDVKIVDIHIYSEKEYLEKLLDVAKKKCIDCENFDGNMIVDDNCRNNLSLNGECYFYAKREE